MVTAASVARPSAVASPVKPLIPICTSASCSTSMMTHRSFSETVQIPTDPIIQEVSPAMAARLHEITLCSSLSSQNYTHLQQDSGPLSHQLSEEALRSVKQRTETSQDDPCTMSPDSSDSTCTDLASDRDPSAASFPLQALPDELLAQCLARVSGTSAGPGCVLLRGVCARWRGIIKTSAFQDLREGVRAEQQWLVTLTWRTAGGLLCKLFDPLTNRCQRLWCSWMVLPPERQFLGTTAVGRHIFALGGETSRAEPGATEVSTRYLESVESYDCVLDQSRVHPPLPGGGRSRFACCSTGDKRIFVLGGIGPLGRPILSCAVLNVQTGEWSEVAPLPMARVGAQAKWCGGRVVLLGGREDASEASSPLLTVEALDPVLNRWAPLLPLPVPRINFQSTVLGDEICVVGGEKLLGENEQMEDLDSPTTACFNVPVVYHSASGEWKVQRRGGLTDHPSLRSIDERVQERLHCGHPTCARYQSRSFALVSVYDQLYLVRRCDKGRSSYCRHIHQFRPELSFGGAGTAWECIHRRSAFSSLLREAGDCWEHSVVEVIMC